MTDTPSRVMTYLSCLECIILTAIGHHAIRLLTTRLGDESGPLLTLPKRGILVGVIPHIQNKMFSSAAEHDIHSNIPAVP